MRFGALISRHLEYLAQPSDVASRQGRHLYNLGRNFVSRAAQSGHSSDSDHLF